MPVARVQNRSRLPSRVMHACGMRPSPTVATAKTGLGRSPQGTKTRSGSGDQRLPLEGKSAKKISSLCSDIFAKAADEVSLTCTLPLRCKREAFHLIQQIPAGNLFHLSPQGEACQKGLLTLFRDLRRRRLMRRQEDSLPSARPSFSPF